MPTQSEIHHNEHSAEPGLKDVLDLLRKEIFLDLTCHHVGKIQEFNAANQTAKLTVNYKRTYFEKDRAGKTQAIQRDYPILLDVPVIVLGGGASALTFPVTKGDDCLVLFNDRDIDVWFNGSDDSPCATSRLHSISDGFALVGIRSLADVLAAYDTDRVVLRNGATSQLAVAKDNVEIKQGTGGTILTLKIINGKISITNSTAEYTATLSKLIGDLTALLTDIQAATTTTMLGAMPLVMPNFATHLATLNSDKVKFDSFKA